MRSLGRVKGRRKYSCFGALEGVWAGLLCMIWVEDIMYKSTKVAKSMNRSSFQ